ncbi:hypothetical protein NPIL_623841 [Nephila pilipes]|uniref:Uncharacterized protein n=1 Tax=Nephila pilipes TaxID=299642 RepID=A0A8X6PMA5_NEPPI|nr:hypothetical protein NPIL_623841 [Nephila pilipes]
MRPPTSQQGRCRTYTRKEDRKYTVECSIASQSSPRQGDVSSTLTVMTGLSFLPVGENRLASVWCVRQPYPERQGSQPKNLPISQAKQSGIALLVPLTSMVLVLA